MTLEGDAECFIEDSCEAIFRTHCEVERIMVPSSKYLALNPSLGHFTSIVLYTSNCKMCQRSHSNTATASQNLERQHEHTQQQLQIKHFIHTKYKHQ